MVLTIPMSARMCEYFTKRFNLDKIRKDERGDNPELDQMLEAINWSYSNLIALREPRTATVGSETAPHRETATPWDHLTSQQAADRVGVTRRRINSACQDRSLPARQFDGRWIIRPDDVDIWNAARKN
jgi:hypothetical protein